MTPNPIFPNYNMLEHLKHINKEQSTHPSGNSKIGWRDLLFSEAVLVNPPTQLNRGTVYPFVDMSVVQAGNRNVRPLEQRKFNGSGSRFQDGDTLMARITPSLEHGKIACYCAPRTTPCAHGSTEFIVIRGRPNVTDNDYAYYLTKWDKVRNYAIGQMTGTSGRQRVPADSLDHLVIPIPPLYEQHSISYVLNALDAKIELNQRMNQTLEEMSRTLFKSWFIDFDPVRAKMNGTWRRGESLPGLPAYLYEIFPDGMVESELGNIPEGWDLKPLDEIADFRNGLALQNHRPVNNESRLPVVKIAQLRKGRVDGKEWAKGSITPECIIGDGDVIFSWSGSLLVKVWCGGRAALNQHLFKVTSIEYPKWFFLSWVEQHLKRFQGIATDKATTMGHIRRHHLREVECIIPDKSFLNVVNNTFESLFTKQVLNNIQSRSLVNLRDTLLPRLISGKLRVLPTTYRGGK